MSGNSLREAFGKALVTADLKVNNSNQAASDPDFYGSVTRDQEDDIVQTVEIPVHVLKKFGEALLHLDASFPGLVPTKTAVRVKTDET